MKPKFNKTWLWISLATILNILIFYFLSQRLEIYISANTDKQSFSSDYNYLN